MRCPSKFLWTPTTRNDFSSSSLFCKFPLIKGYEREEIHQSIQSCWCSTIMPFCLYIEHYSTFIDKSNFFFHSTFHSWRIIGATLELDLERNDLRNCQYLLIIDKHWRRCWTSTQVVHTRKWMVIFNFRRLFLYSCTLSKRSNHNLSGITLDYRKKITRALMICFVQLWTQSCMKSRILSQENFFFDFLLFR